MRRRHPCALGDAFNFNIGKNEPRSSYLFYSAGKSQRQQVQFRIKQFRWDSPGVFAAEGGHFHKQPVPDALKLKAKGRGCLKPAGFTVPVIIIGGAYYRPNGINGAPAVLPKGTGNIFAEINLHEVLYFLFRAGHGRRGQFIADICGCFINAGEIPI